MSDKPPSPPPAYSAGSEPTCDAPQSLTPAGEFLVWVVFVVLCQALILGIGYGGAWAVSALLPAHPLAALVVAVLTLSWLFADLCWLLIKAPRIRFVQSSSERSNHVS